MTIALLLSLLVGTSWAGAEPRSNHLRQFEIRQCNEEQSCFQARGQIGFWSREGDSLSATDVSLEISKGANAPSQVFFCQSFNFDLPSQFIICDNQKKNTTSVTVNSHFELRKYRPL